MPKIDIAKAGTKRGSGYPAPFDKPCAERLRKRLGDAGGLNDFGVNMLTLPPGVWSSQRHWHSGEDEFVYVLSGEVTFFMEPYAPVILRTGDSVYFDSASEHGFSSNGDKSARILSICLERSGDVVRSGEDMA